MDVGEAKPRRRRWIWLAVAAFAILLGVPTMLPQLNPLRWIQEKRWVAAAQTAVEEYLRASPRETAAAGSFKQLTGSGYDYPFWNINAAHLIAHRTGQFSKETIPIRIYVWEPDPQRSTDGPWAIERTERSHPQEALSIFVRMK